MKIGRSVAMSVAILAAHPLRTLLSLLGVMVGVGVIVLIVSIGDGMREEIRDMFRTMGTDLVIVRAGEFRSFHGRARSVKQVATLKTGDAEAIKEECSGLKGVAPAFSRSSTLRYAALATTTSVEAASPEGLEVRSIKAAKGRLYDWKEDRAKRRVVVLGATVASNLFESGVDPLGKNVNIGRLPFTVIGIAEEKGTDDNGNDMDDIAFVPLDTGLKRLFHVTYLQTIYLQGEDETGLDAVEECAAAVLRKRHRLKEGEDDDFTIQNQATLLETSLETSGSTTDLVVGVAGISLVVAGIGILAVMLMSVRERRWEIGLRRAVGARQRDILFQFLMEATLLSVAGGLLGLALGFVAVEVTNKEGWARAVFSEPAALYSTVFSIVVGVVFGIYPAIKASRMEPIDALRAE